MGKRKSKRKSKEPLSIDTLAMRWNGNQLENLITSLYKKKPSKEFLPIEENLICDGIWNKTRQTVIFNFDEKETLYPITTFYLVMTIPLSTEPILKNGTFSLLEHNLPKPFKQSLHAMNPFLTIHDSTLQNSLNSTS